MTAALLVIASATVTLPVFASGYGPAPFYRPATGAPSSQQGQNAQTLRAEQAAVNDAYGDEKGSVSESGHRVEIIERNSIYSGH
ncbi:hypothetical protein QS306_05870 [Paraburkholderia bonniea]|nr:hypothetical protein [Paraburkholderia bonniea]WJF91388.1 hypothetical protein QS306_05870 [Paraburkholderia bonniea]WJF94704.1 hypothetical protein QS308_05875 [Paraburkholderia bonniea]